MVEKEAIVVWVGFIGYKSSFLLSTLFLLEQLDTVYSFKLVDYLLFNPPFRIG